MNEIINKGINNLWWIVSLLILFSPYLFNLFYKKGSFSKKELTGIAATLGIFGTFVGIFISLQSFNVNDIQGSIPQILEGLKTAFATSIAGMGVGLIIKFVPAIYLIKNEEAISTDDEGKEIISILRELNYNSKIGNQEILFQLKNIEKSVAGDGDSTLLTQVQKLRTSFADKQDELISEFRVFAKHVADNSSKAIIEALTQVIRDFNVKITEQFGDNFRQLNQGVEKMLLWQANYKNHIQIMTEKLNETINASSKIVEIFGQLVEKAEKFNVVSNSLYLTTENIRQNNLVLNENLKSFADLGKRASESLPAIVRNINELTTEFSRKVNESTQITNEVIINVKNNILEQLKNLESQQKKYENVLDKQIQDTNHRLTKQIEILDEQLGNELTKSLNSLGSSLATLSNKFVNDYSPLTDKLRKIVDISRELKN